MPPGRSEPADFGAFAGNPENIDGSACDIVLYPEPLILLLPPDRDGPVEVPGSRILSTASNDAFNPWLASLFRIFLHVP